MTQDQAGRTQARKARQDEFRRLEQDFEARKAGVERLQAELRTRQENLRTLSR